MSLIANEQTKLLANAFDRHRRPVSRLASPRRWQVTSTMSQASADRSASPNWCSGWQVGLQQRLPYIWREDEFSEGCIMNEYAILAFVITPALVIVLAWGAVFLFEHHERR